MAASVQYRRQERSLGMVMKEKDDDLALFLEMHNQENKMNNLSLLSNSDEFDDQSGSKPDSSSDSKMASIMPDQKTHASDFLNPDNNKTDYDWLLTPPGTPLFPSLDMESQKTVLSHFGSSNGHKICPKSRLAEPPAEPVSRNNTTSRQLSSSKCVNSSTSGTRKPSPSGRVRSSASRSATPTIQPTLTSTTKSSRPSTPTSRATLQSSTKPKAPAKRSSTPTAPKSTSRSATPTRVPSSSSVTKSNATMLKNSAAPRGTSPTLKCRQSKPSNDAPPNVRASLPERPASTSRGRPSPSIEISSNRKQRRQSCSPSRGLARNGSASNSGRSVLVRNRGHSNGSDDVNPVLMGTQMVERVVNMRKLAPPKKDDHISNHNNSSGKDNSGFGRTLSKKSFDMALRHMDIRRSIPGNMRPMMTKVPASSLYSVRSDSTKSRTDSVSDSPLATSSNASSEFSFNNNPHCLDGIEVEDNDFGSENQ